MEVKDALGAGEIFKESVELFKFTYPDIAQPAAKKVGIALETVFGLANTFLIPAKLLNAKSELWFKKHMMNYEKRLSEYPIESIVEVIPDIGLPILDRFTYLESDEIAELFIELLLSASIKETSSKAHPSFIQILNRISVDEARMLKFIYINNLSTIPFILYEATSVDGTQFVNFPNKQTILEFIGLLYPDNTDMYFSNLESMGLLYEELGKYSLSTFDIFDEIQEKTIIYEENAKKDIELRNSINQDPAKELKFAITKNQYSLTLLGHQFLKTCNKNITSQ